MKSFLKTQIRQLALKRLAPSLYSPNYAPPPLYKLLRGRRDLSYIDVGAFNGEFFNNLNEFATFRSVILVEPIVRFANELKQRFPNHVIIQGAAGNENKNIMFNEYPDAPYMSSILALSESAPEHAAIANEKLSSQTVRQYTLDDLAEKYNIGQLDLLKIDTQGSELAVLAGSKSLLSKTAAIWIEVSFVKLYEQSCLLHEVHDALYRNGFHLTELTPGWRSPSGELAQADGLFLRRSTQS